MATLSAQIAHIWRRLGFGPAPGDVEAGVAAGTENLINDLTTRTATTITYWNWPVVPDYTEQLLWEDRIIELMAVSPCPVQERSMWTLMGLLVIARSDEIQYPQVKRYTNSLKNHALGSYTALLSEVLSASGMQWYLNGFRSTPPHPNENLARELMELFALGLRNPLTNATNYSENDVKEIARALTGYRYNYDNDNADFRVEDWDSGNKTFLGAPRGAAKLPEVISAVTTQPAYPLYIAKRFYTELVGLDPSNAVLSSCAAAFSSSGNLRALIQSIALRPEFLTDAAIRARVKSPIELVASTVRALGLGRLDQFYLAYALSFTGQQLHRAPNVNGWPGNKAWLHPGHVISWSSIAREFCQRDDGTAAIIPARQSPTMRRLHSEGGSLSSAARAELCLRLLGVYDASAATSSALGNYAGNGTWTFDRAYALMHLALQSPEFMLN